MVVNTVSITLNPYSYGRATQITCMAQQVKEKERVGTDQHAILKDQKPPIDDAEYVRDVMARFDRIDFDECRPSTARHRKLQAKKN
jgi:hypothetical protein